MTFAHQLHAFVDTVSRAECDRAERAIIFRHAHAMRERLDAGDTLGAQKHLSAILKMEAA